MMTTENAGIHTKRWHESADRYLFDFNRCKKEDGWAQVDTESDAWYYGAWANPSQMRIVTYTEGDVCLMTASSPDEFVAELRRMEKWHADNDGWMRIDPLLSDEIERRFTDLGLADLMDYSTRPNC